ncbi:MAG: Ig-like domain-containing protein [Filimonas sp.]|nr:Ig-like domain-containing protein [Filimonas sp.]
MKKVSFSLYFLCIGVLFSIILLTAGGCANIIPPGGGPRDTIPPKLASAVPKDSVTSFKGNRIVLTFNEYVTLDNINEQLVMSPFPKNQPIVESKLRNVTVKLRDSLEANTTYTINFGNAIKDVNEGNVARQMRYVFSTGSKIDGDSITGHVQLAETGKIDSTLLVLLHSNLSDTAIYKVRPRYIAKLDGKGNFRFLNMPQGKFNIYVLPNDYAKKYDDSTKIFAFGDSIITAGSHQNRVLLYAYQEFKEVKEQRKSSSTTKKNDKEKPKEKPLKLLTAVNGVQDLLEDFEIAVDRKIRSFDTAKIVLTDTNYKPVSNIHFSWADTSFTRIALKHPWVENSHFKLIIQKDALTDSAGIGLPKTDTLSFVTKRESEYGSLLLRFPQIDLSQNPVLMLLQGDKQIVSEPITKVEWYRKLFPPGDYEVRILFDHNKNGIWDKGNFKEKIQPEIVLTGKPDKVTVRSNFDREFDVSVEKVH